MKRRFLSGLRAGNYVRRFEFLEDRRCLSCDVSVVDGTVLQIIGDEAANFINIHTSAEREVSVACDGGRTQTFTGIERVHVDAAGGDDRLAIDWQELPYIERPLSFEILTGAGNDEVTASFLPAVQNNFNFHVDLGSGDDTFEATLPAVQSSIPAGEIGLEVLGQQGNDRLSLLLAGDSGAPQPHMFPSALAVNFEGGHGDDNAIIAILNVAITERMSLNYFGGGGDDVASLNFTNVAFDAALSTNVFGGVGEDVASLNFTNVAVDAAVAVNVDGGHGADEVGILIVGGKTIGDGLFALSVDGGFGNDVMVKEVTEFQGSLMYSAFGGPGDDVMINDELDFQGSYSLVADFGPGNDVMINEELDFQGSYSLFADFGPGDDVMFHDENEFQGSLAMVVRMGLGDDVMVHDDNEFQGSLNVTVDGEGGDDDIRLIYGFNPQPDPPGEPFRVSLIVDGGDGNDMIHGDLRFDPESRAPIDVVFEGNAGDDDLGLLITGHDDPFFLNALVDGGAGDDIARITRNVLFRNVEELFFIER